MTSEPSILDQFIDTLESIHDPCVEEGGCGFYASEEALSLLVSPAIMRLKAEAWAEGQHAGWCEGYSHGEPGGNPYL